MLDLVNAVPNSPIKMCPVLKFAVSRTDSVIGRTMFLTSSMMHRNGFKNEGDPEGWKWAMNRVKLYDDPIIMIANHIGRASTKLIARCLVILKI